MSVHTHDHIQIGLFERGDGEEICAPACEFSFNLTAMNSDNEWIHLNARLRTSESVSVYGNFYAKIYTSL